MNAPAAPLTAGDVLAAIAAKYRDAVLLPELSVADHDHDALADQWHATGQAARLPYPAGASRCIDALMLEGSTQRTAIEVKISRSDFRKETPQKRRPWERITDRFVYACPAGIIAPEEIPPHCGLWWINPDRSLTIKARAKRNRHVEPLPHHLFVTVAYRLKTAASQPRPAGPPLRGAAAKRMRPTARQPVTMPASQIG